jgi:zinc transport system ATP-binding protein
MINKNELILELRNVSFSYSKIEVVKDVSFLINKGDFIGIIGPNGSGKTTLLKIILGILRPQKGLVFLFQEELQKFKSWHKIGYVSQKATNIDKNFPATVREVVAMGLLANKKQPKIITKKDNDKIVKALSIVKMQSYLENQITDLSGGQQQRVLIAKAITSNPELLILDEPTTGVDQDNQLSFYKLLNNLNKQGITIILVSHDIGRITKYVTKIASVNQTLEFYGKHEDFCAKDPLHKHSHSLCLNSEKKC